MNRLLVMPALAAVVALGLTGCKDDTQPRLQQPAPGSFEVYEPALNNYTYYLEPTSTIELVTSQPNYGLGLVTQYQVQVCLSENFVDATADTEANYRILPTVNTQAKIEINGFELAVAMNSMHGINNEDDAHIWDDNANVRAAQTVYARVLAYVADPKEKDGMAPGSAIYSNVVKIKSVQPYFAINVPAVIYLIGQPQGWDINSGSMPLSELENGIGSDIYSGTYEISGADIASGFRFYKELGSWGDDGVYPSIGATPNDFENTPFELDDDLKLEVKVVAGKGNFQITNWPGGWLKMTVNLVNMTAAFEPGEAQPAE